MTVVFIHACLFRMSRMHRVEWSRRQRGFRTQSFPRHDRRLQLEALEDRRMLAVVTVGNDLDPSSTPR
jgi:hypothetical protein